MLPILISRAPSSWVLVGVVLLLVACAPSDPPPTSPLADTNAPTGTVPSALPTFPAGATVMPSDAPSSAWATPASSAAVDVERITGDAIARLAEWIGGAESEFRLTSIEATAWPDSCLGIANPGIACADVITPGYRVTLHHIAAPNSLYLVHTSNDGRYVWAPSRGPEERTVASVDPDAGMVALERSAGGDDQLGIRHRAVLGSTLVVALRDLQAGQRVVIGTADPLEGGDAGLIVVLVPVEER